MKKIISERKDILLFLFVNFFLIDWKITVFSLLFGFYLESQLEYLLEKETIEILTDIIFCYCALLRIIILPVTYWSLERHTSSEFLLNLIKRFKSSRKWKIIMLILTSISPILICAIPNLNMSIEDILIFILFMPFILSTPSYLVLYLWWWIEDKIKKRKMSDIA